METCSHTSCALSSLKGLSNGLTYGSKVRFTHSIVMSILFQKGQVHHRIKKILKQTYKHSRLLGLYVLIYKSVQCALTRTTSKSPLNSGLAGALAGYTIFTHQTPISSQITSYLLSRIITGTTTLLYRKKYIKCFKFITDNSFAILTSLCWGLVMFLFQKDRTVLQKSLKSSMVYLYDQSDKWVSFFDFLPFGQTVSRLFQKSAFSQLSLLTYIFL